MCNLGEIATWTIIYLSIIFVCFILPSFIIGKHKTDNFKLFLKILLTNLFCSFVPWLGLGFIMGFPAMFLSSICLTYILKSKENS